MILPSKRKPERSGIQRAPERVWPRHRRFVRSLSCCVQHCQSQDIEFAHVRTAANSGTGLKPPDWAAVPCCSGHHAEQHRIGVRTFEARYKLDLGAIAAALAARSPDTAMKEAMMDVRG